MRSHVFNCFLDKTSSYASQGYPFELLLFHNQDNLQRSEECCCSSPMSCACTSSAWSVLFRLEHGNHNAGPPRIGEACCVNSYACCLKSAHLITIDVFGASNVLEMAIKFVPFFATPPMTRICVTCQYCLSRFLTEGYGNLPLLSNFEESPSSSSPRLISLGEISTCNVAEDTAWPMLTWSGLVPKDGPPDYVRRLTWSSESDTGPGPKSTGPGESRLGNGTTGQFPNPVAS